jgi:hypothetical protein
MTVRDFFPPEVVEAMERESAEAPDREADGVEFHPADTFLHLPLADRPCAGSTRKSTSSAAPAPPRPYG